jgi:hypothetical protein
MEANENGTSVLSIFSALVLTALTRYADFLFLNLQIYSHGFRLSSSFISRG